MTSLAIDDLQWADELTLGFVRHMIATSVQHRIPVLMLITWRGHGTPTQFAADNVHSVEVNALSRMISDMLALDAAPDHLVDFVADRAAGNPFQVGEYLQAAVERNLLQRDQAGDWQLGLGEHGSHGHQTSSLPESMDMLLAQRIDGVPRPAQRVLETSAVIGRNIPLAVLEKALSRRDVDLDNAIHDLLLRGLLEETEPGSLSFTHGQIREVTYSRIPAARRAAIHRAVADALESDGQIADHLHARIARHRKRAGQPNRAAEAYVEAGRNYAQRFAAKEARRMYEAAIKLLKDRPGQRAQITLELVERIILPTENYELAGTRAAKALVTATEQKLPKLAAIALGQIALAGHPRRAWKRAIEALSMFKEAGRYASHEAAMLELISRCAAERDNTEIP